MKREDRQLKEWLLQSASDTYDTFDFLTPTSIGQRSPPLILSPFLICSLQSVTPPPLFLCVITSPYPLLTVPCLSFLSACGHFQLVIEPTLWLVWVFETEGVGKRLGSSEDDKEVESNRMMRRMSCREGERL